MAPKSGNGHGARWTFESLKDFLESLVEANDRRYEQRFNDSQTAVDAALVSVDSARVAALLAVKEAVQKQETASEKRFESVNEFRATLADQQRMLMPRIEAEQRIQALEKQLEILRTGFVERRAQGAGMREMWGYIIGAIGVLLAILAYARGR